MMPRKYGRSLRRAQAAFRAASRFGKRSLVNSSGIRKIASKNIRGTLQLAADTRDMAKETKEVIERLKREESLFRRYVDFVRVFLYIFACEAQIPSLLLRRRRFHPEIGRPGFDATLFKHSRCVHCGSADARQYSRDDLQFRWPRDSGSGRVIVYFFASAAIAT
jgi:hypothetical protein